MSLGNLVLVLVVYVLAVARLTRLVNYDKITDWLRLLPAGRAGTAKALADEAEGAGQVARMERLRREQKRWLGVYEFLGCAWCVGFWFSLAFAAVPVVIVGWPWWTVFPVALAASHLIGAGDPLVVDDGIELAEG